MCVSEKSVSPSVSPIRGILDACKPDLDRIEETLGRHFASHVPFVNEVSEYVLFLGGKRLRPLLTVCAARLCGRDDEAVFDLSIVPEYLHAASLLHDDVVDEGQLRRGKPPAYKVWGNKAAVLVGDFLYARAIELASRFGDVRIARTIAETVALMAEGEILQLLQATKLQYDRQDYMEVINRKTAALIAASCKIGAQLSGADDAKIAALENYGFRLGQAFQMVDDMLDYTATSQEFGKAVGTDLAEGKLTLPLVIALERSDAPTGQRILKLLRAGALPSEADLQWLRGILDETGGLRETLGLAEGLVASGQEELTAFAPSASKTLLTDLAHFVVRRRV